MIWHEYCALKSEIRLHRLPVTPLTAALAWLCSADMQLAVCRKEINPWWVAEEGEMRSLVSGFDGALKPGDWLFMNMTGGVELHGHRLAACLLPPEGSPSLLIRCCKDYQVAFQDNNKEISNTKSTPAILFLENTSWFCQVSLRGSHFSTLKLH